jgi:hypothetical protein
VSRPDQLSAEGKGASIVDLELLTRVADAAGVSGFEEEIQAVVSEVLAGCCDEVRQDRLGNVIGLKRSGVVPGSGLCSLPLDEGMLPVPDGPGLRVALDDDVRQHRYP